MLQRVVGNQGVRTKIMIVTAVLAGLTIAISALAVSRLGVVYNSAETLVTRSLEPTMELGRIQVAIQKSQADSRQAALSSDRADADRALKEMDADDAEVDAALPSYRWDDADPAATDRFALALTHWRELRDAKLVPAARVNDL